MKERLNIVGIGPGSGSYILPEAAKLVEDCDVVIGGQRNLELFNLQGKEQVAIGNNLEEIYTYIIGNIGLKKIVVLATGDPGLFSIMTFLKEHLPDYEINVVPGISSFQYLCAKLGLTWDDVYITSVHGREQANLSEIIKAHKKVALFAGGGNRPDSVCWKLTEAGLKGLKISVGENLSYPNERIIEGKPEEIAGMDFESLSIMIIRHSEDFDFTKEVWGYKTPGIPDELFIRADVPMTKSEVRAVSMSKLRLCEDNVVYDIGAGTGSVAIECALVCKKGKVYAIEKNSEAIGLIHKNIDKFGIVNMKVIKGEAPFIPDGLPLPDRIFIGGSSGKMDRIFDWIIGMDRNIRVVVNAVTLESAYEAIENFENKGFEDIEITNIAVSRSRNAGGKHLMQALNPVYVICGDKRSNKD